jgi:DNA adenine methylase
MIGCRITPPLKWHGGKHYLAERIVALMSNHIHYVEPYAGGLSVLLRKDPDDISEVVNDIDGDLTNFWRILQADESFERFSRKLQATPFSESEWLNAQNDAGDDPVARAVCFFIHCRQSLAGRMNGFATLSRTRTRRRMNEQASAWLNAVEGLEIVHSRLKRVVILNREALEVIRQQDGPETLFYLDPPYLDETRTSKNVYKFEMSAKQHSELLGVIKKCVGKVMISGYPSEMYDRELADWHRHVFKIPNQAAGGSSKREMTEVVWCNF